MALNKKYQIGFVYSKVAYTVNVVEITYPNGYTLYKLRFETTTHWLVKHNDMWKNASGVNLCRKLFSTITRALSQHDCFIGPHLC
jgi:hypothetical protein